MIYSILFSSPFSSDLFSFFGFSLPDLPVHQLVKIIKFSEIDSFWGDLCWIRLSWHVVFDFYLINHRWLDEKWDRKNSSKFELFFPKISEQFFHTFGSLIQCCTTHTLGAGLRWIRIWTFFEQKTLHAEMKIKILKCKFFGNVEFPDREIVKMEKHKYFPDNIQYSRGDSVERLLMGWVACRQSLIPEAPFFELFPQVVARHL